MLDNFEFRNQIPRLSKADTLGTLIEKLTSPEINLSPDPVLNSDGSVKHPGVHNHGMGSIFEELVRKFNEENNEEAGERSTVPSFVRDPPPGGWFRHSNSAGTLGTQGCENNHALHPRLEPWIERCSEPYGQNARRVICRSA